VPQSGRLYEPKDFEDSSPITYAYPKLVTFRPSFLEMESEATELLDKECLEKAMDDIGELVTSLTEKEEGNSARRVALSESKASTASAEGQRGLRQRHSRLKIKEFLTR